MEIITSTQNPRIRALRALQHAKARREAGCFLVEGIKLCEEALRDAEVVTLLADAAKAEFGSLLEKAGEALLAPWHVVASVCEAKTPQGIVAAVRLPAPFRLENASGAILALDGVQDPGNVGTMLRTAEAAGFAGALLSDACADAFAPKTVRASMGSVLRLPIWRGRLADALHRFKAQGGFVISADFGGVSLREAAGKRPSAFALVIGSEGQGVHRDIAALADLCVSLPMRGRAESLNAAVAAGILMYGLTETDEPAAD